MAVVNSFAAISSAQSRILILGSMPGVQSLRRQQYYAHPQNRFWPILAEVLGFDDDIDYPGRVRQLRRHRVALWDVLKSCYRPGSMDADIHNDNLVVNDFDGFLSTHKHIRSVFFNGSKAQQLWYRFVAPQLAPQLQPAECLRLPSTSPAYAAMSYADKLRAWGTIREYL